MKPSNSLNQNQGQESRYCLHTEIEVPHFGLIHFFNTHFTFIDVEQCRSSLQLLEYVTQFPKDSPKVIMGDFNTYFDFEWPVEFLKDPTHPINHFSLNPCSKEYKLYSNAEKLIHLNDVWMYSEV